MEQQPRRRLYAKTKTQNAVSRSDPLQGSDKKWKLQNGNIPFVLLPGLPTNIIENKSSCLSLKRSFWILGNFISFEIETMTGKGATMWLISEEIFKTKLYLQGLVKVKYGWIVSFTLFVFSPCFQSWILQWDFVFCGLHWYFKVGRLRADMVGLCLFPLTINCRPTAMQCSHRQKRGSIVICNFVFLYFWFVNCFSGIRYLNQPWYVNLRTNLPNLSNYSTSRRSLSIQLLC